MHPRTTLARRSHRQALPGPDTVRDDLHVVAVIPRADGTAAYVLEGWPMNWSAIGFKPVVKPSIEAVLKIVEAA